MKKSSLSKAGVVALLALLSASSRTEAAPADLGKPVASAERNSFREVTSQLDPGGSFYLYVSTEQWLEGLSGKLAEWRQFAENMPNLQDSDRKTATKAFDILVNVIKDSGLEDISGFGMSCIAREKGFYRTKSLLHHYPGKGSGFAWKLFGQKPHSLDGLNLLPANTALASFSDVDVPLLWSVVQKEVAQSGFPQAQAVLDQLPEQFEKATQLKWNDVVASLGGEFGLVLTLDSSHMITLPIPGQQGPMEIPEPALMLVAKVSNDTVFNRIDTALQAMGQNVISSDKAGLKMRTVPVPLPLPISLRPTVATTGGYLFIATTDALIQEALAVKAGQKPGLKSTDEFKRLAVGLPEQGNQFSFLSQRFGEAIRGLQKQALEASAKMSGDQKQLFQSLISGGAGFSYAVGASTDQGLLSICNGNQNAGKLVFVCAAIPAVIAAIAIPNFVKAREVAQKNACINNLRQIDGAKQTWALEKKKPDTATPTREELAPYLKGAFPTCPAGGTYTIKSATEVPICSHPGHKLPQL